MTLESCASLLGVDITKYDTSQVFKLGTKVEIDQGNKVFRYVSYSAAKSQGSVYIIDENWAVGNGLTTTNAAEAPLWLGVPQTALSAPASGSYYTWVQTGGDFDYVNLAISCSNRELYTTATSGRLDDTSGSTYRVDGLKYTGASPMAAAGTGACSSGPREIMVQTNITPD